MLNERHGTLHYTAQMVVHRFKVQAMQIRNLPGDVKGEYLPRAVLQYLVPTQPPIEHEAALGGFVALADDILIRSYLSDRHRKFQNRFPFLGGEACLGLDLVNERLQC
jgi:hypothetical protein